MITTAITIGMTIAIGARKAGRGMEMKKANLFAVWAIAGALACSAAPGWAATTQENPAMPAANGGDAATDHRWPVEQLVPLSVREAWRLGGRTEQGFFDIVKELTELSAQKRGITLPDNKEAGIKAGDWIKKEARKDPDQLLYVIVDRAVRYSARVGSAKAGS